MSTARLRDAAREVPRWRAQVGDDPEKMISDMPLLMPMW